MIKPIYLYGKGVLRTLCSEVSLDDDGIKSLITDLFDTAKNADGIGLAAPQIGISKAVFVVDTSKIETSKNSLKKVFINPKIVEEWGQNWSYKEGCLSIPGLQEMVSRKPKLRLEYLDESFTMQNEIFDGMTARIIQHEYDHLKGILFTDKLNGLKKILARKKMEKVFTRKKNPAYPFK